MNAPETVSPEQWETRLELLVNGVERTDSGATLVFDDEAPKRGAVLHPRHHVGMN